MLNQNHLKIFLIMELKSEMCSKTFFDVNFDLFEIKELQKENLGDLPFQKFCDLRCASRHGAQIFTLSDCSHEVIAFAALNKRGQRGDYCKVRKCDYYISDVFVYPKYRGHGYAQILLKSLMNKYNGLYRLCVRTNNKKAINTYNELGFRVIEKRIVIRIIRNLSLPVFEI